MVQIFPLAVVIILRSVGGVVTVAHLSKDGRALEGVSLRAPTTEAIRVTLHKVVVIRKTRVRATIRSSLTTLSNILLNRFNRLLPPRNRAASVQQEQQLLDSEGD